MSWIDVCEVSLEENVIHSFEAKGVPIIVLKTEDGFSVFHDRCSHQDIPLSSFGQIRGGDILCLAHGAKFCIKDGEVTCAPATEGLVRYPHRIEGGRLLVET